MESPNSNYKNLASILLINAGNSSDTTIVVDDADAAIMPSAPFYATIMPTTELANITNSEIVYVTASSSSGGETTYTVSRGQRGTTAQSWDAGKAVMTQAVYTQDVQAQKQGYYNAALSSGSDFTITNASAPTTPVVGSRISVIFDTDISTASTVTIAINGGTAYNVAVSGVTFDSVGTLTTSITIASGKLYDMIFDGTEWVIANTFGKVTSHNIDYATFECTVATLGAFNNGQGENTIALTTPLKDYESIVIVAGHSARPLAQTVLPVPVLRSFSGVFLAAPCVCYSGSGFVGCSFVTSSEIHIQSNVQNLTTGGNATDCVTRVLRLTPKN